MLGVDTTPDSSNFNSPNVNASNVKGSKFPSAAIGGVIVSVVVVAAALLILVYCYRRRKQRILAKEDQGGIGEFQNPAFVGDPHLYLEPISHDNYEEPHTYLTVISSTTDTPIPIVQIQIWISMVTKLLHKC